MSSLEFDAREIVSYAMKIGWISETFQVHSWMVLLGILRFEKCTAAQVLVDLGLTDIYGAWNEVLWALNVCDGLEPRAWTNKMEWGARAYRIVNGAIRFAYWAGRSQVKSQDLLMALAAGEVLESLFPDLDMSFANVKKAIESRTGDQYNLPMWEEDEDKQPQDDIFS